MAAPGQLACRWRPKSEPESLHQQTGLKGPGSGPSRLNLPSILTEPFYPNVPAAPPSALHVCDKHFVPKCFTNFSSIPFEDGIKSALEKRNNA